MMAKGGDLRLKGGNVPVSADGVSPSAGTGCELTVFCRPVEAIEDVYAHDQERSKRSRFITLFHTATKSCRNFSWESSHP